MILYLLDTLQLTQEKLSGSVFYWVVKKILRVYKYMFSIQTTLSSRLLIILLCGH